MEDRALKVCSIPSRSSQGAFSSSPGCSQHTAEHQVLQQLRVPQP